MAKLGRKVWCTKMLTEVWRAALTRSHVTVDSLWILIFALGLWFDSLGPGLRRTSFARKKQKLHFANRSAKWSCRALTMGINAFSHQFVAHTDRQTMHIERSVAKLGTQSLVHEDVDRSLARSADTKCWHAKFSDPAKYRAESCTKFCAKRARHSVRRESPLTKFHRNLHTNFPKFSPALPAEFPAMFTRLHAGISSA